MGEKLKNMILPFPRMIMQPPAEGAVEPIVKRPLGVVKRVKMPKAFGHVKTTKLLDGEISPVEKAVNKNPQAKPMKGVTRSGKVNVPTGKIRTPGKTPVKTTVSATEGQERAGHKYVKRERNPQGKGYRYWYKLPNGQLGTKKELEEATKGKKKRITGGLVQPTPVAEKKKNKIPKQAKPVPTTPPEIPAEKVLPGIAPDRRQGWLARIGDTLERVKELFGGQSLEQMNAQNKELATQLGTVINLIERLRSLDIGTANKKVGELYKFSPSQINQLTEVGQVQELMKEAQNPDNFAEMVAAKLDPKTVIARLDKQMDFLVGVNKEKQGKEVLAKNAKYIEEQTTGSTRVLKSSVKPTILKYDGDFNKDNRKAASIYREYLINQDRSAKDLPAISLAQYNATIKKKMNEFLKATGATSKKDTVLDPDAGTITITGPSRKKLIAEIHAYGQRSEDASFQIKDKVVNGAIVSTLRFSRIGGEALFNPIHNSVLNAAKEISDRVRKNPGTAFRAFGDKIEQFDDKATKDSSFARIVIAAKGSGKTQLIEGSTVASILGNAKGTYKAFIVDPDNTLFQEIYADDSALTDEQKNYKNMIKGFIDDGRLILFSPKQTLHQETLNDDNYKDFLTQVNDRIIVEGKIQATNRESDPNWDKPEGYVRPAVDVHMDEFGKIQQFLAKDKALKEAFTTTTVDLGKSKSRKDLMRITVWDQASQKVDRTALGDGQDSVVALGAGVDGQSLMYAFHTGQKTVEAVKGVSGTDMVDVKKPDKPITRQLVVGDSRYDATKFKVE